MEFSKTIYKSQEGGYVFISHSHKDIVKVRIIRNLLEEQGFEPLCFYLKCLNEDDEVEGLIQREIDARDIFLYCESENARQSKWVQKERAYINTRYGKTVFHINLDECEDLKVEVLAILQRARAFVSYTPTCFKQYQVLQKALTRADLQVYGLEKGIQPDLDYLTDNGCYIGLFDQESLSSPSFVDQLKQAIVFASENRTLDEIVLVQVGDIDPFFPPIGLYLAQKEPIRISPSPTVEELRPVIAAVKESLRKKIVYHQIVEWVKQNGPTSISGLQRGWCFGFNRATRYMDRLIRDGYLEKDPATRMCKLGRKLNK